MLTLKMLRSELFVAGQAAPDVPSWRTTSCFGEGRCEVMLRSCPWGSTGWGWTWDERCHPFMTIWTCFQPAALFKPSSHHPMAPSLLQPGHNCLKHRWDVLPTIPPPSSGEKTQLAPIVPKLRGGPGPALMRASASPRSAAFCKDICSSISLLLTLPQLHAGCIARKSLIITLR